MCLSAHGLAVRFSHAAQGSLVGPGRRAVPGLYVAAKIGRGATAGRGLISVVPAPFEMCLESWSVLRAKYCMLGMDCFYGVRLWIRMHICICLGLGTRKLRVMGHLPGPCISRYHTVILGKYSPTNNRRI
jgi:hypothetical protein